MVKNKRNKLVLCNAFKNKLEKALGGKSINSSSNNIIKKNIKEKIVHKKPLFIGDNANNESLPKNEVKNNHNLNNNKQILSNNNQSKDLLDKNYKDNIIINNYINYPENKSNFYVKICEISFFISVGFVISKIISK